MSTTILSSPTRTAPWGRAARRPLYVRPVLLATDGTNTAGAAVRFAAVLARRRQAEPHVLTVLHPPALLDAPGDAARREGRLRDVRQQLLALGGAGGAGARWPVGVEVGSPVAAIGRAVSSQGAGSIVIGLRPHGTLDRLFRDETALLVMRNAAVPVLAVTPALADLPRRVVAAVDFSRASLDAVRAALSVVGDGGTLFLAHVQPEIDFAPEAAEEYGAMYTQGVSSAFARLERQLDVPAGVSVEPVLLRGTATGELRALADRVGADLIALGSQSHAPARLSLGGVTQALAREGRVSLLVVPPTVHTEPRATADARPS